MLDSKDLRRTDRYIQFGLVAAREAMDMAGLPDRLEGEEAEETGVILATGLGGVNTLFDNVVTFATRGPDRISPFLIPMGIGNVGAGQIAINFGPLGPNFATVSACASSGHGDRRGVRDDPARRRPGDARGRHRIGHARGARRRLHRDAGPLARATTTRRAHRGRSTRVATGS